MSDKPAAAPLTVERIQAMLDGSPFIRFFGMQVATIDAAAGRLVHSTSGPVTTAARSVIAPPPLSLTPMARPRCSVSTQSAMSAVDATLAAHQPSPTRNVPSVTDMKPPAKATNSAPISAMPTPGYITHSRPKRSDAQPSGMVKANMPAAWNEWENAIAVSPWP